MAVEFAGVGVLFVLIMLEWNNVLKEKVHKSLSLDNYPDVGRKIYSFFRERFMVGIFFIACIFGTYAYVYIVKETDPKRKESSQKTLSSMIGALSGLFGLIGIFKVMPSLKFFGKKIM